MARMLKTAAVIFLTALLPLALLSCKKAEEPQQPPIKKAAPQPQQPAAVEPVDKAAKIDSTIEAKLRNPFQSHIMAMKGVEGPKKIKGPLECCELSLFRVVAVVYAAPESSYALVHAPDGKRYVVKRGDTIGSREGRIVKINVRSITLREYTRDQDGNVVSTEDVDLRLPEKK